MRMVMMSCCYRCHVMFYLAVTSSPTTGTLRWIDISKNVEFVHDGQDVKQKVDDHEYDAKLDVEFPAVQLYGNEEEYHRCEEGDGGVCQTWKYTRLLFSPCYIYANIAEK